MEIKEGERHIFINADCMDILPTLSDRSVNMTFTDIPYDAEQLEVKGKANALTFDLTEFLNEVYRVTNDVVIIFCGKEQFSDIFKFFRLKEGSTRMLIWDKVTGNPVGAEGQYISNIENAVWFKRKGSDRFSGYLKGEVFRYPRGDSKLHPTEKNHSLIRELILDNTFKGDIVLDTCMGSGAIPLVALQLDRVTIGIEIDKEYYDKAVARLQDQGNYQYDIFEENQEIQMQRKVKEENGDEQLNLFDGDYDYENSKL